MSEHSPGAVAAAIEQHGCYGYDRFGRFRPLNGPDKVEALDLVAQFFSHVREWNSNSANFDPESVSREPSPMEEICEEPVDHSLWNIGWPDDKKPEFSDQSPIAHEAAVSRDIGTTERITLLTIIAALCKYSAIDPEGRGAAIQMAKLTEEFGAAVTDDTIRKVLKQIPDAVESRKK